MRAPPALAPISISPPASAFIHDQGGSVYVWEKGPAGGVSNALDLLASAACPADKRFHDPEEGDEGEKIFLEEGMEFRKVLIRLQTSPPEGLVAFGASGTPGS